MGTRRLHCFTLIVCMALPGSTAHARTTKKVDHPSAESISARHMAAKKSWRRRGQHGISANRVREIQTALIRENYLKGRANGVWDQRSKDAMTRFQSDKRWQSKVVPDSRALIKLGLGPDHAGLINPETAAISFIPGGGTRQDRHMSEASQRRAPHSSDVLLSIQAKPRLQKGTP